MNRLREAKCPDYGAIKYIEAQPAGGRTKSSECTRTCGAHAGVER